MLFSSDISLRPFSTALLILACPTFRLLATSGGDGGVTGEGVTGDVGTFVTLVGYHIDII